MKIPISLIVAIMFISAIAFTQEVETTQPPDNEVVVSSQEEVQGTIAEKIEKGQQKKEGWWQRFKKRFTRKEEKAEEKKAEEVTEEIKTDAEEVPEQEPQVGQVPGKGKKMGREKASPTGKQARGKPPGLYGKGENGKDKKWKEKHKVKKVKGKPKKAKKQPKTETDNDNDDNEMQD